MTRFFFENLPLCLVFALAVTLCGLPTVDAQETTDGPKQCDAEGCGEYGTTVVFATSPAEAAKQALDDEKLVFVLHVSGEFETSDYT